MYHIGDKIVHLRKGACYISDILMMDVNEKSQEYYLLSPVVDDRSRVYVPLNLHEERMRPVTSSSELHQHLHPSEGTASAQWIDDQKERTKSMKEIIKSADFGLNYKLTRLLLQRNKIKPLNRADQDMLSSSELIVYSEIAIINNISYENVKDSKASYMHVS